MTPWAAALATLVVLGGCAGHVPAPVATQDPWTLVWSDEFERDGLPDASRWTYDVGGHGWGNQELQDYRASRLENARVEGGRLIVEARREPSNGREYSSARMFSTENWTYGRFEIKARLPTGRGTWPAIWMLPRDKGYGNGGWPDNGELDIMEHVGYDPDVVHASVHTAAYNHIARTQKTATVQVAGARSEDHVYVLEWTPEEIRAFVDGTRYFTFGNERLTNPQANDRQWPFDRPFHLILNLAVGGFWGGAQGVDPDIWPARLEVDYVRVYRSTSSR